MLPRSLLPVAALFLACLPCAFGQLPKRLEKCLPYPTLAQEIREMQPAQAQVRVHVTRVEFDPNDSIPADAQEEISEELRRRVFKPDADRNRGYFKVTATAKLTVSWSEEADIGAAVAISATPGRQYRMGDIRIESTDSFYPLVISPEVLRDLIPLQRGELFSVEKVRSGLQNLALAYGREGYGDMTQILGKPLVRPVRPEKV